MKTLLSFFPAYTSFVRSDIQILKQEYNVREFEFRHFPKWRSPFFLPWQFFFLVFYAGRTKVMLSQFSGYHTILPALWGKIFNVPHYVVLHGTECNNFPEWKYGFLIRPLLHWCSEKTLQWSTKILPVSEALVSADYSYVPTKFHQQGFTHFYRNVNTPVEVIYNGIRTSLFHLETNKPRKKNSFITISSGMRDYYRRFIKGLDLMIELARLRPEYTFTFVGARKPDDMEVPDNITVIDFIPNEKLWETYHQHEYYMQLSISEGFGISVCEAMMCGCVPIVSNVGVLPFIASDKGYVLPKKDLMLLDALCEKAITDYATLDPEYYRAHIIRHFDSAIRNQKLLSALRSK